MQIRRFAPRWITVVAGSTCVFAVATTAGAQGAAPNVDACLTASDEAQVRRDQGRLIDARNALRTCAQSTCPAVVQKNCAKWLAENEAALPTIVLSARAENEPDRVLESTTVLADGAPLTERITGAALPIDPGPHVFTFTNAGRTVEVKTVIGVGEKNRAVVAKFAATDAAPVAPSPKSGDAIQTRSGPPPAAWIAGVVGVVGLGAFAVLGITATNDLRALEDSTCARLHNCDPADVRSIRTRLTLADVGLAVGAVGIGTAAVLWWTSRGNVSATASSRGAFVGWRAAF